MYSYCSREIYTLGSKLMNTVIRLVCSQIKITQNDGQIFIKHHSGAANGYIFLNVARRVKTSGRKSDNIAIDSGGVCLFESISRIKN